jgi:PAS domain S-box-containing protein
MQNHNVEDRTKSIEVGGYQTEADFQELPVHPPLNQTATVPDPEALHSLINNLHIGVLIQGPQAEILFSNRAARGLLGLTESQLLGKTSFDPDWNVIHEDGTPFPGETHPVPQALATGRPVHNVIMGVYRPERRNRVWLLVNAEPELTPEGRVSQVVCTFSDITELKQTSQAIQQQSEYLTALHETALALMNRLELRDLLETIVKRAGALVDSADGYIALVEPDESAIVRAIEIGHPATEAQPPPRLKKGQGIMGKVWESGEPLIVDDYSTWPDRLAAREYSPVHAMIAFPLKSEGKVVGVLGLIYLDETRRFGERHLVLLNRFAQLAELALDNVRLYSTAQRRLTELATVQRVARVINSTLHLEEIFQTVVNQIKQAFGYEMVSIYLRSGEGLALQAYTGYDHVIAFLRLDQGIAGRVARTGQAAFVRDVSQDSDFIMVAPGTQQAIVVPLKRGSGEVQGTLLIESMGQPRLTEQDFALLTLLSDQISVAVENARLFAERKQAEEARLQMERNLFENQKLRSLGILAGGIAHDFNNLLVGILNNAEIAEADLPADSPARQVFQQIEEAARRAAGLTSQMLAYSGQGRFVVEPVALNELVESMAELLRASVDKNIQLHYQLPPDLPLIAVDAGQLRQVILNLVINASEALYHHEGVITIRTGQLEATAEYLRTAYLSPDLPQGVYLFLEVTDNGSGMDEATLSKIFDPFFSTRFTGRGLGLPAVLGIVRGHQGVLKVASQPGKGSTFRILLPYREIGVDSSLSGSEVIYTTQNRGNLPA